MLPGKKRGGFKYRKVNTQMVHMIMISASTPVMEAIKVRITASRAHRKCTLPPCHKNPCFHSAALLLQRPRKKQVAWWFISNSHDYCKCWVENSTRLKFRRCTQQNISCALTSNPRNERFQAAKNIYTYNNYWTAYKNSLFNEKFSPFIRSWAF